MSKETQNDEHNRSTDSLVHWHELGRGIFVSLILCTLGITIELIAPLTFGGCLLGLGMTGILTMGIYAFAKIVVDGFNVS